LGRFDDSRQLYQQTLAQKLDDDTLHIDLYALDFIQSDSKGMAEQAAWFSGRPELENEILTLEADTEAYSGHVAKSRQVTERAIESAVRADNKESAAMWQLDGAWREALFGNVDEARREAEAGLALAPESYNAQQLAGLVLARSGGTDKARTLAAQLAKQYPVNALVQSYWLPAIHAQLAATSDGPAAALEQLQNAANFEFGFAPSNANNSCLYPTYLRGEAYLAAGQGGAAAAEFRKIIDRPGIVWNCATGALAHLELGRSLALAGDQAKARAAYQDFLTLWKDADTEIPILKEAKAEFAKLQ
jgi:eukaryotic-like serine/threonine-protein kinase